MELSAAFSIFDGIPIGGMLYLFALTFEKGIQLKKEQELTV